RDGKVGTFLSRNQLEGSKWALLMGSNGQQCKQYRVAANTFIHGQLTTPSQQQIIFKLIMGSSKRWAKFKQLANMISSITGNIDGPFKGCSNEFMFGQQFFIKQGHDGHVYWAATFFQVHCKINEPAAMGSSNLPRGREHLPAASNLQSTASTLHGSTWAAHAFKMGIRSRGQQWGPTAAVQTSHGQQASNHFGSIIQQD
ncbi:hypothetical protein ACLOJK_034664, partial [Asimina triloba]